MLKTTAARLSAAFLGYMTLIVLLLTLNPFYVSLPARIHISFFTSMGDVVANILLFLPIGFLYRLTGGRLRGALITGAVISLTIEATQIFIPARASSLMDFLCNVSGAGLGAVVDDLISKRISITAGMVGQLRLETPLMGLVYLMIPLLWVDGLSLRDSLDRWMLTVLLGVCGAIIFSELYRQWLGGVSSRAVFYAACTTGGWFLLGSSTGWLSVLPVISLTIGIALLSAVLAVVPPRATDRRFEHITLQRLLPFFILYVLLMALWYPFRSLAGWHGVFGFTTRMADTSLQGLYPRIEYVVAFTVIGYLTAEWRGRDELPLRRDLPRLLLVSAGSAILLEFLVGFQVGLGASFIRALMAVFSALLGGTIYHLLRAHIRYLLGRS